MSHIDWLGSTARSHLCLYHGPSPIVYVPRLPTPEAVAHFFRFHRGWRFASSALMDPITKRFVAQLEACAHAHQIPVIAFAKGQRTDDVAQAFFAQHRGGEGVVFIGKAQEKVPVFRTERRRSPDGMSTYPWIVRSTALVSQWYLYLWDEDFGPCFLNFSSYFPYTAKLCLNGHEWVKRQLVTPYRSEPTWIGTVRFPKTTFAFRRIARKVSLD